MRIIPVSLALFYRQHDDFLEIWTQKREDDGIYHGLLEFPGGKIEENETPLLAVVREVEEEVGIKIDPAQGRLMGLYENHLNDRNIILNVFLFPDQESLEGKGEWLKIDKKDLSAPHLGKIPYPNHQIIDDLFRSLYSWP
jgi:mutator protein MutT